MNMPYTIIIYFMHICTVYVGLALARPNYNILHNYVGCCLLCPGKKSLREIFQLYFMMKDRIFSKSRIGFGFNTEVLEEILQEYLDPDIKMTDVTHPKYVVISAHNSCHSSEVAKVVCGSLGDHGNPGPYAGLN